MQGGRPMKENNMKVYIVMYDSWLDGFEQWIPSATISSIVETEELAKMKVEQLIREKFNEFVEEDPEESKRVKEDIDSIGCRVVCSSDGHEKFYAWFEEREVEKEVN